MALAVPMATAVQLAWWRRGESRWRGQASDVVRGNCCESEAEALTRGSVEGGDDGAGGEIVLDELRADHFASWAIMAIRSCRADRASWRASAVDGGSRASEAQGQQAERRAISAPRASGSSPCGRNGTVRLPPLLACGRNRSQKIAPAPADGRQIVLFRTETALN
jgi:hypothetical protein